MPNKDQETADQTAFVKCPHCENIYRQDHLAKHIHRKHEDNAWRRRRRERLIRRREKREKLVRKRMRQMRAEEARGNLHQCPYCSSKIRKDRLSKHIENVHKDVALSGVQGEMKSSITAILQPPAISHRSASKLEEEIHNFLQSKKYETEGFGDFIVARHREHSRVYVIKIGEVEGYIQYKKLTNVIMNYDKFKGFVNRLGRVSAVRAEGRELQTDVITKFGWHAWEPRNVRHSALDYACIHFGEPHILHLLVWMRNTWPKNPLVDQYSDVVMSEYEWFERERASTSYHREKRELIGRLEHELLSLGIPPQFQRFFGEFYEIDHWFVIVC